MQFSKKLGQTTCEASDVKVINFEVQLNHKFFKGLLEVLFGT